MCSRNGFVQSIEPHILHSWITSCNRRHPRYRQGHCRKFSEPRRKCVLLCPQCHRNRVQRLHRRFKLCTRCRQSSRCWITGADYIVGEGICRDLWQNRYCDCKRYSSAHIFGVEPSTNSRTFHPTASPMHMEGDIEFWHDSFAIDVLGVVNLIKESISYLLKSSNPSIIVVSSFMAREFYRAPPAPYGPFKAAQLQHVQELSHFYGPRGIRVNAISPGPILCEGGPWDRYNKEMPEWVEQQRLKVALRRLGGPQEVANAVLFLASPLSSFITGTNLLVDGGIHVATQF